jgi:DNA-binding protein YbaB
MATMFEGLKGMAGMASLMRDLPRIQARMEEIKASLSELRVESTSEGGVVKVIASGTMEIVDIVIDGEADPELLRDTVNRALVAARSEAQRRLTEAAEELGLPMPPGGLLPGGL